MKRHTITLTALFLSLFAALWLPSPQPASAANIVVSTTADVVANDGLCSLREAVIAANTDNAFNDCIGGTGNDTIQFDPALPDPAIFVLTIAGTAEDAAATGDLDLTGSLTISGDGQDSTIIDGNAIDRVLHIQPSANVNITGITVREGNPGAANGGGIAIESTGQLTLNTSTVISNTAVLGGGLFNGGVAGSATVESSQIISNTASAGGGGISNFGILILKTSTIDNNQATTGGGVDHQGVSFNAENVTVSGNMATDNGGGIANHLTAILTNVTITGNNASTGANILNDEGAQLSFVSTIIANPISGANCFNDGGLLNSLGYNLESSNVCSLTETGDIINTDPLLGPLQNNGGPTPTHALPIGSPAIDKGDNTSCPATDQRSVSRPLDGDADSTAVCDIGAFEAGTLVCGIEAGTPYTISSLSLTVTTLGTDLSCVQVTRLPFNHPLATTAIPDLQYWIIDGLQSDRATAATPDYIFNLTLPHGISPQENAKVCKSPGGIGGAGWDCDRTDSLGGLVWRDGITVGFSDWAVGEGGPTALTLNIFSASSAPGQTGSVIILFGTFFALLFTWKLWRYRQPE
jgi:CSLREA domain-containing protein